jgi:hypothetical protein
MKRLGKANEERRVEAIWRDHNSVGAQMIPQGT